MNKYFIYSDILIKRKILRFFAIIFCIINIPDELHSQTLIKGTVISKEKRYPLPYTNIGVLNKSIGTVTDKNGSFQLVIDRKNYNDSIKVSIVGYKSKVFLVQNLITILKANPVISLDEKIEALTEVIISNKKLRIKYLGNRAKSRKNLYEAPYDMLGSEIGVKIKLKSAPTFLKEFNTRVLTRNYSDFKFRLNIYNIKNGLPDVNLVNRSIIISSKDIKDGWINFNLEPYNIYVYDDFFVCLEWIQGNGRKKLQFPASLFGPLVVERNTSQDKWNKHSVASIGFNVKVEYR